VAVLLVDGVAGAAEAGRAGGIAIIVDALRASTTIAVALALGAAGVQPVLDVEEARAFLGRPGYLIAGERGGAQLPGFDFGNSPTQLQAEAGRLAGRRLVLTTSNGTRCVAAAAGAAAILAGALPNASAVAVAAARLAGELGRDVYIVAAGVDGAPAEEDRLAGDFIRCRMEGCPAPPAPELARRFRESPSGRQLAGLGYAGDVAYCARPDVLDVVPVTREGAFVAL